MNAAIIPARGGSKRIPRKNVKGFVGKPIISYAIEAAIDSHLFEKVIVSTDDTYIAQIAKNCGAEVPFLRPLELADDHTPTVPVVAHAIRYLHEQGDRFENACCIYPGVPFIQVGDLIAAYEMLLNNGTAYSYPVTEFPSVIQRALRRFEDGRVHPLNSQNEWVRTQDLETFYYDAGQFYWGKVSSWLSGLGLQSNGSGLVIPQWRVVDIDTPEDWLRAELLYKALNVKDY